MLKSSENLAYPFTKLLSKNFLRQDYIRKLIKIEIISFTYAKPRKNLAYLFTKSFSKN